MHNNNNRVLFITAHPDDCELAAGGTVKYLISQGLVVKTIVLTISEYDAHKRKQRRKAAENAAAYLGYELHWFEEGKYDQVEDIAQYMLIRKLDELIGDYQPAMIFSHSQADSHHDHILTAKAVLAASRRWVGTLFAIAPNELKTPAVFGFVPNTFVDISDFTEAKSKSIQMHGIEGQNYQQLIAEDYLKHNQTYGIINRCSHAEAFQLIKQNGLGIHKI